MSRTPLSATEAATATGTSAATARQFQVGPRFAALWEIAGLWVLIVIAGVLLIACLLLNLRTQEEESIQRARLALTLAGLQESIEGDLALGFDLPDNRAIQSQLETALAGDRQLHAIDVVDRAGVALFSTDRGAIGESLHYRVATTAEAGAQSDRAWFALIGSEAVMGMPLHNAFGEVVGHISTTYAASSTGWQWTDNGTWFSPVVLTTATMMVVVLLLGWVAARWALRPHYRHLERERTQRMAQALTQATAVRQRMDDCLARLDESERQE